MKKSKQGFTLIELLVVIAIIGMLATLSIVALNTARSRSRDAKRVADIKQLQTALELYYNDWSGYPTGTKVTAGNPMSSGTNVYMGVVPTAPTPADGSCTAANNAYAYTQDGAGASYHIVYCLGQATGNIIAGQSTATPGSMR